MSEKIEKFCKTENSKHYEVECDSGVKYYINAFKRLDETGKHTWNWSAFFFGGMWMAYRKMYLFCFLYVLATAIFNSAVLNLFSFGLCGKSFIFLMLESGYWGIFLSVFGCLWIFESVLTGYFGNILYYKTVKSKIRKGYHLLEKYRPTSISSSVFWPVVCFADWISRRSQLRVEVKEEVNEETIQAYLNPNKKSYVSNKIADALVWIVFTLVLVIPFIIGFVKGFNESWNKARMQREAEQGIYSSIYR